MNVSDLSDEALVALIRQTHSSAKATKVSTHEVFERLSRVSDLLLELRDKPDIAALVYRDQSSGVGQSAEIREKLVVGRFPGNADNTLQINDEEMSRRHFEIVHVGDGVYTVRDLASTNGLYLNGLAEKITYLVSGTEIRAGRTNFVFVRS
jgi:hypothetical protein